ncbi:MAG: hypothetical protein ACON5K_01305 [Bacteroidia bacterium]
MDVITVFLWLIVTPHIISINYYNQLWKFIRATEKTKSFLFFTMLTIIPILGSITQTALGDQIDDELRKNLKSKFNINYTKATVFNLGWIRLAYYLILFYWFYLGSRNVSPYMDNSSELALVFILFLFFSVLRWFNGIKLWIILFNLNKNINQNLDGIENGDKYQNFRLLKFIPVIIFLLILLFLVISMMIEGNAV